MGGINIKKQIVVYLNKPLLRKIENARGKLSRAQFLEHYIEEHVDESVAIKKFSGPKLTVSVSLKPEIYEKIEIKRGLTNRTVFLESLLDEIKIETKSS